MSDIYLGLQPGEIRLLEILPSSRSLLDRVIGQIECNLIHTRLDKHAEYEALSYCWGTSKFQMKEIVLSNCGRHKFQVTDSLYQAIQQFQRTDTKRLLWVDSICINQNDPDEKADQVSLMTDIYRGAEQVLGWLGVASRADVSVVEMSKFSKEQDQSKMSFPNPAWTTDFSHFLGNPFFSRLWIIQEVAVAKRLILCFGKYQLGWEDFRQLLESFLSYLGFVFNTATADVGLERIMMLVGTRNIVTEHVSDSEKYSSLSNEYETIRLDDHRDLPVVEVGDFARLVTQSRTFGATDPRDRIFALCGLVPKESNQMVINYDSQNTADKVYREFTMLTIVQSHSLNMLVQAGLSESNLPSWVPDFTKRLTNTPLNVQRYRTSTAFFEYKRSASPNHLVVSGHKIGTIRRLYSGLENVEVALDEAKYSTPWKQADPIPLEQPQLLENEVSATMEVTGVLYSYFETRNKGSPSSYKDLARSVKNAACAVYDGFTKTVPRISVAMEHTWHDSALSTGKMIYTQSAYQEMLIGGPSVAGIPADICSRYMDFIAGAWREHLRDNPFKPMRGNYEIPEVPAEVKRVYQTAKSSNSESSGAHSRTIPESKVLRKIRDINNPWQGEAQNQQYTANIPGSLPSHPAKPDSQLKNRRNDDISPSKENENIFWSLNRAVQREVERMSRGRKFATTDRELGMAWVPQLAREDDEIWILIGAGVPFVLRPVNGRKGMYRLVGEAYHYGVMQGEYFSGEYQANYTRWIDGPADFAQKEDLVLI